MPHRARQYSFVEIDHEVFSMVILSLPLIQKSQSSVSGKRMYTNLKKPVLKPNTNECFQLLYELMNPSSAVDTKLICKFIHEALER